MEPLETLVTVENVMGAGLSPRALFHYYASWFQVLLPSEASLAVSSYQKLPSYFVGGPGR